MVADTSQTMKQGLIPMNSVGRKLTSISAVVATYDRADYLRICLQCLMEQDYKGRYEIIVADDGSTDHTPEVISEARQKAGAQASWLIF